MAQTSTKKPTAQPVTKSQTQSVPAQKAPNGYVMRPYNVKVPVVPIPVGVPVAGGGGPVGPRPVPVKSKKGSKRNRREREYFFVMRKGVCFFMFLVSLVMLAVLALSFLNILPQFTSLFVYPDLTDAETREALTEVDEDGYVVSEYEDQSQYVGVSDGIYGLLGRLTGDKSEEEAAEAADDATDTPAASETEGEEGEEEAEEVARSPFYDDIAAKLDEMQKEDSVYAEFVEQDGMFAVGQYLFLYGPIAYVVMALILLLTLIKAFFGMFGKRIFKRFGLAAIILLVCSAVVLLTGLVGFCVDDVTANYESENVPVAQADETAGDDALVDEEEEAPTSSILDFSKLGDFVTQAFQTYPESAEMAAESTYLTFKASYGVLILLVMPVVLLLLSIFARRKVPYSIFDR